MIIIFAVECPLIIGAISVSFGSRSVADVDVINGLRMLLLAGGAIGQVSIL